MLLTPWKLECAVLLPLKQCFLILALLTFQSRSFLVVGPVLCSVEGSVASLVSTS